MSKNHFGFIDGLSNAIANHLDILVQQPEAINGFITGFCKGGRWIAVDARHYEDLVKSHAQLIKKSRAS